MVMTQSIQRFQIYIKNNKKYQKNVEGNHAQASGMDE